MEENTQELSNTQVEDSSGVAEKFSQPEFNRSNKEKDAVEQIADKIASNPELSDPESQSELPNKDSDKKEKVPPTKEAFNYEKWDGKVESLPEKLQKIVKDNQAMATAKAQEVARLKAEIEQNTAKRTQPDSPAITQEEYEAAQISHEKFIEVVNKLVAKGIEAGKAELVPLISEVKYEQTVAQNEKFINEFAEKNPDFWDMYNIGKIDNQPGILETLVDKHKNLEVAYNLMKHFEKSLSEKAKNEAQGRVKEKKAATTFGRTPKHSENIMYIEGSKDDVLAKQIEMTMAGKNIQVKQKKN